MAIVVNKNTFQSPLTATGRTGTQSIKFIPAPRVYIKTADAITSTPVQNYFTKSNGTTPSGWTDLGIVVGMAKVTYTKKVKEVLTGIDEYLRAAYVGSKNAHIEFDLSQTDDYALENISGLTASVITTGSVVNYQIGEEDLNQVALLLVAQNKLDGKEWQFYNPNAYISFVYAEQNEGLILKCDGLLPYFRANGQTSDSMLSATVFA